MELQIQRLTNESTPATPILLRKAGYLYLDLIGEGSNGKTYKAKSRKTGEIVAIKELKFSDNLKNYELFLREAEVLKSIHTPGVPRYYEYITGEGEFTECWIVQQYIEGASLFDRIEKRKRFMERETLNLLLKIANIIAHLQTAYAPPIIHRDIKPSNILLHNNELSDAYLIDFGAVANPQRRNLNSTVAGTVGYMAPEQLMGDCTIQSDYYALGATALHMLTGQPPSELPSNGFDLQFEDALKKTCPSIHDSTIDLLHKLLAQHASDRPQNADELIQAISTALREMDTLDSNDPTAVLTNKIAKAYIKYKINEEKYKNMDLHREANNLSGIIIGIVLFAIGVFCYLLRAFNIIRPYHEVYVFPLAITICGVSFATLFPAYRELRFYFSSLSIRSYENRYPILYNNAVSIVEKSLEESSNAHNDNSHKKNSSKTDVYSVSGTIASISNGLVECVFITDNKTHTCIALTSDLKKKYHVNDSVPINYYIDKNKVFAQIEEPLSSD